MEEQFTLKQGEGNRLCTFCLIRLLIAETGPFKTILQPLYFTGMKVNEKMPIILLTGKSESD